MFQRNPLAAARDKQIRSAGAENSHGGRVAGTAAEGTRRASTGSAPRADADAVPPIQVATEGTGAQADQDTPQSPRTPGGSVLAPSPSRQLGRSRSLRLSQRERFQLGASNSASARVPASRRASMPAYMLDAARSTAVAAAAARVPVAASLPGSADESPGGAGADGVVGGGGGDDYGSVGRLSSGSCHAALSTPDVLGVETPPQQQLGGSAPRARGSTGSNRMGMRSGRVPGSSQRMRRRQEQVIFGHVDARVAQSSQLMLRLGLDVGSPREHGASDPPGAGPGVLRAGMAGAGGIGAGESATAQPATDPAALRLLHDALGRHPLLAALDAGSHQEVIERMERVQLHEGESLSQARRVAKQQQPLSRQDALDWNLGGFDVNTPCYLVVERGTLRIDLDMLCIDADGNVAAEDPVTSGSQDRGRTWSCTMGDARASSATSASVRIVRPGESFNEDALLGGHGIPLAAAGVASAEMQKISGNEPDTVVWLLDPMAFRSTVASLSSWRTQQTLEALKAVELLRPLSEAQLATVAQAVRTEHHAAGKVLIRKGDTGDCFYILRSGTVVCTDGEGTEGGKQGKVALAAPAYFGERALLDDIAGRRSATVTADTDVEVLKLQLDDFTKLLGPLKSALELNMRLTALRTAALFQANTGAPGANEHDKSNDAMGFEMEEQRFLAAMTARDVPEGEFIARRGTPAQMFMVVNRGTILCGTDDASEQGGTVQHGPGACFGEHALLDAGYQWPHDVVAGKDVEVYEIGRAEVHALCLRGLHHRLALQDAELEAERERIERKASFGLKASGRATSSAATPPAPAPEEQIVGVVVSGVGVETASPSLSPPPASPPMGRQTTQVTAIAPQVSSLTELELLETLGVGSFGTVRLVRHIESNELYALKQLSKATVVLTRQQKNIRAERKVLFDTDHPFVIRLAATFQDNDSVYMLTELVQGGELFRRMHGDGTEENPLPLTDAQFCAACLASVLTYIHERQIAYRDIKPENLLIDAEGYLKVVDWGFAKHVEGRTFTVCGTPEYLAPESIKGTGHSTAVDCWAFGIIIYEMLAGYSPFVGDNYGDMMKISQSILKGEFTFPETFPDEEDSHARDLITRLLKPETERLGCLHRGMQDVREHIFFRPLLGACESKDWARLDRKELVAPWIPTISHAEDMSNFEDYEDDDIDPIEPFDGDQSMFEGF